MKIKCPKNKIFEVENISIIVDCPKTCDKPGNCSRKYFEPQVVENIVNKFENNFQDNQQIKTNDEDLHLNNLRNRLRKNNYPNSNNKDGQNNEEIAKLINSSEVLIHIGVNTYSAKSEDIEKALCEIFTHWNTDAVFQNHRNFTTEFTNLLKIRARDKYQEIVDDVLENNNNINSKFYHLFYKHLFNGKKICKEFYFAEGYQKKGISLICRDQNDIFKKINCRHDYLRSLCNCQNELLDFLHLDIDNLLNQAVLYINKNYNKIGYFKPTLEGNDNYYDYILIDTSRNNFINNLSVIETYDNMLNKLEFINQFKINKNGQIIIRADNFIKQEIIGEVDDSVYEFLGITEYNTSQCKDVLEIYLNLVKEYINTEPNELNIGPLKLTVSNFYCEIENIVHNAYSKCTNITNENNNNIDNDIQKLYLLLVLKNNHILNYFVNRCNNSKKYELLNLIKPNINYREYFNSGLKDIYTFFDGERHTINEYFQRKIGENSNSMDQIVEIIHNDAIFKLIEQNVGDLRYIETRINDLAREV